MTGGRCRGGTVAVFALLLSVVSGCSTGNADPCPSTGCAGEATSAATTSTNSGSVASRPGKLLVVVLENHSDAAARQDMPHLTATATRYARATKAFALAHPSLPNYLAIAGGSTFSIRDDRSPANHRLTGPSVFGQVLAAGESAKTYAEAMTGTCSLRPSGRYAAKHNPWAYFSSERAACRRFDVSAGTPARGNLRTDIDAGRLPTFGLLIPDLCHDAHDCSLGTADRWVHSWLSTVVDGPDFRAGRLAVVVTFDEDDGHAGNHISTVVLHPSLHGEVVRARLDHYALSRAASALVGRRGLRHAAGSPDLLAAFGLAPRTQ